MNNQQRNAIQAQASYLAKHKSRAELEALRLLAETPVSRAIIGFAIAWHREFGESPNER